MSCRGSAGLARTSARVRAADLGGGDGDGDYDSLFIDQLTGKESDISTTPYDPATTGQPSRFGRAQELDVKIGGRCKLSWTERRRQRRAKGGIEHGGQKAALYHPSRFKNPSVAVKATSIVPASGSTAMSSNPSVTAAPGSSPRPSMTSQNGPRRVTGTVWQRRCNRRYRPGLERQALGQRLRDPRPRPPVLMDRKIFLEIYCLFSVTCIA